MCVRVCRCVVGSVCTTIHRSSCTPTRKHPVQTHQIHVSSGRAMVNEVRSELFSFPEVLDVFITGQPDALVVVCSGRPRPGEWLSALRRVGYDVPAKRRTTPVAFDRDRTSVVAPSPPSPSPPGAAPRAATEGHRVVNTSSPAQAAAGY
jgi:hypothetical protein